MKGYIYSIKCISSNKYYIGKTIQGVEKRWKAHLNECKRNYKYQCVYLNRAIRKYGSDNFVIETIDTSSCPHKLNKLEEYYIKKYNSLSPNGYNLTKGGEGCKASEETKLKMSKWQKGKPKSQSHKKSLSEYAKNRPLTHRRKIAESNKSRKASEETKLKMSKSRRKLSDRDINHIIEMIDKGYKHWYISIIYDISEKHVSRINCGWKPLA